MISYKVKNLIVPVDSLDCIKLKGLSDNISRKFFEKRVLSDFAKNVIYKEAEDAFRTKRDDEKYVGLWQGEFWGKLMLSAVEVYKYTADEGLLDFLRNAAHTLLSLAREDGYLNTYRDSMNIFRRDPEKSKEICGLAYDWNWNIWCRKYTLWGLLAIYEVTSDKEILFGASRLADQMIDELKRNGVELRSTGTFNGLPSCSILKPLLILYGYTENKKYFDYCKTEIIDNWQRLDGAIPNLINNALSGKAISEWYPNSNIWAKAYEMMSCFEGIAEFYRYSGDETCLKALESFYNILIKHELNPLFGVGYNDMFGEASSYINAISEPCDSIHFMRICYELYLLTGEKKYMDNIELTYYNAFLAGVFRDGEFGSRAVRNVGRHMWGPQAATKYQHCCVNNMPRALVRFAESSVMYDAESLIINMYEEQVSSFKLNDNKCEISISKGYFDRGNVNICVRFSKKAQKIKLRIPEWCDKFDVKCSEESRVANGYLEVLASDLNCNITVDFNTNVKIHEFNKEIQVFDNKSYWQFDRWISDYVKHCTVPKELFLNEKRCTVTFGPLLLAKCKRLGNSEEDIFSSAPIDASCSAKIKPISNNGKVNYAYEIEFSNEENMYKTTVCDYASSANEKLEDDKFFSIYF